jgi:hypothetical protein
MRRLRVARFVLAEVFRLAPGPTLLVAPLGLAAAAAKLLTAGLLVQFITSYAAGGNGPTIDIARFDLGIRVSPGRAWFWVAVIAVSAAASVAAGTATNIIELRLGRRYATHAARRLLGLLLETPYRGTIDFDPSIFVFSTPALLGMLAPALQLLAFAAVMFALRPALTVVILGAAVIFLGPVMLVTGRRVIDASRRRRSSRNLLKESRNPMLALFGAGDLYLPDLRRRQLDRFVVDAAFTERFQSVYRVRAMQAYARLSSGLFAAGTAVILAVGLTVAEQPDSIEVGSLVLYVIVAQFAAAAIGQIGTGLATFDRHLDEHRSYLELVTGDGGEALDEPRHAGEVWLVRDAGPPTPSGLARWLDRVGVGGSTRAVLVLDPVHFPPEPLASLMTGGRTSGDVDADADLTSRCRALIAELTGRSVGVAELDRPADTIDRTDPLATVVGLGPAVLHEHPLVVVVPVRMIGQLGRREQRLALAHLRHHHVVLVGNGRDHLTDTVDLVVAGVGRDGSDLDEPEDDE